MNSTILVTGALGHIGSSFIHDTDSNDYDEILMIDNLSTQRYASLFRLPKDVRFRFYEQDILDADLKALTQGIDVVIHFAAITDAPSTFDRPDEVERINHHGTKLIAEACIENDVKLVFVSTTSIYGAQSELVTEECPEKQLNPHSPYAFFKRESEKMLVQMGEESGLKFVIFRFGTIFGTSIGMRFHTAVNKFCWQAVMGQPLTVWRTALKQQRPYLGIRDAVSAINFFIDGDYFNKQIYNVVSTNTTVEYLIDCISTRIENLDIQLTDSPIMNQLSYNVSVEKVTSLGLVLNDQIIDGIQDTIDWLKCSNNVPNY